MRAESNWDGESMKAFGVYLKDLGVISAAKLEEATRSQVVFGGRLGTNLVELGYLTLSEISRHLAEYLELPVAPREWLEAPNSEALGAISRELAEKHSVLPLHLEKRNLHVAMLDPRDPIKLDEIAFASGSRVVPYAIPEVELLAMLEHRYGIRREVRYVDLSREESGEPLLAATGDDADTTGKPVLQPIVKPDLGLKVLSQDLLEETTFSVIPAADTTGAASAGRGRAPEAQPIEESAIAVGDLERPKIVMPGRPTPIAVLEAELLAAVDRDAVSECVLRLARRYSVAAALFIVRGGIVSGYRGDGEKVPDPISGVLLPVESDCAITSPVRTRLPFRGLPPSSGLDANLLDSLGRSEIVDAAVHPIMIRDQVVNLLYTDCGEHELGDTEFAALGVVARLAASAYERLILEAKSRGVAA